MSNINGPTGSPQSVSGNNASQQDKAAQQSRPDEASRDQFNKAMQKKDGKGKEGNLPSGADLLASMGGALRQGGAGALGAVARQAEGAGQASGAGQMTDMVDKLADRILVSQPKPGSDAQEVRIKVSNDVMPDTEVRLTREGNGLRVELVTGNYDSNHVLRDNSAALQTRLSGRLQDDVNVSVDVTLQDGTQDSGDGRSRQQRDLYDEMNAENDK